MTDAEKVAKIQSLLGAAALEVANPAPRRIFLTVAPSDLVRAVEALKAGLDCWYVITISGVDMGETFEIVYHFGDETGNINVRTRIPKAVPRLPSICAVIPGAVLYERELQDLFGMVLEGIPDPRRLVLPDDWPEGVFPLRKDWKHERPPEIIPGGKR